MSARTLKLSGAVVWASLFFGISPLASMSAFYYAWRQGVMPVKSIDYSITWSIHILGGPALLIDWILDLKPQFWYEHCPPSLYWRTLAAFLGLNVSGWFVLLSLLQWLALKLKQALRSRSA